jgi:cytochrome c oxidase cbb3-type subunit 3
MEENSYKGENSYKPKYDGKPLEHEFDGIKELNNPIPPWLMSIWYITVIFSVIYFVYYHVYEVGLSQDEEYARQMAEAGVSVDKHKEETSTTAMVLLTSAEDLAAGEAIYKEKLCATCHGMLGEGNAIGPNLTDKYFLHGNTIEDVYNIIYNGVPTKGMTPYKDQLTQEKIVQVGSYVLSLVGTNPPNPKDPQGELMN